MNNISEQFKNLGQGGELSPKTELERINRQLVELDRQAKLSGIEKITEKDPLLRRKRILEGGHA